MPFRLDVIIAAVIAFISGVIVPFVLEKIRNKKEQQQKVLSMDNDLILFKSFMSDVEKRLVPMEERVKNLELNISHNTGLLNVKMEDMISEDTHVNKDKDLLHGN